MRGVKAKAKAKEGSSTTITIKQVSCATNDFDADCVLGEDAFLAHVQLTALLRLAHRYGMPMLKDTQLYTPWMCARARSSHMTVFAALA
jgi:pyruvate-formate lyase-activating enzyme